MVIFSSVNSVSHFCCACIDAYYSFYLFESCHYNFIKTYPATGHTVMLRHRLHATYDEPLS